MKQILSLIFLILFAFSARAEQKSPYNKFNLRFGFAFTKTEMESERFIDNREIDDDDDEVEELESLGFGINSSIFYRFTNWEFGVTSDFLAGKVGDVTFIHDENSIRGGGFFRLLTIGPQIKYHFDYNLFNKATPYLSFGPMWSLQTFVFDKNIQATGTLDRKKRISFENYGANVVVGLQESNPYFKDHPIFIEFGYSYFYSYKVSILDASNITDVISLQEGDSNDFSSHYIVFRMGMILF